MTTTDHDSAQRAPGNASTFEPSASAAPPQSSPVDFAHQGIVRRPSVYAESTTRRYHLGISKSQDSRPERSFGFRVGGLFVAALTCLLAASMISGLFVSSVIPSLIAACCLGGIVGTLVWAKVKMAAKSNVIQKWRWLGRVPS